MCEYAVRATQEAQLKALYDRFCTVTKNAELSEEHYKAKLALTEKRLEKKTQECLRKDQVIQNQSKDIEEGKDRIEEVKKAGEETQETLDKYKDLLRHARIDVSRLRRMKHKTDLLLSAGTTILCLDSNRNKLIMRLTIRGDTKAKDYRQS